MAVNTVPGAAGQADIAHYVPLYPGIASAPRPPASLVNFGEAVNFPLILGFVMGLFGAAHAHAPPGGQRGSTPARDRALEGARFHQGSGSVPPVCWQASTVAMVGIIVGIPFGCGRRAEPLWRAFATNLGAVPHTRRALRGGGGAGGRVCSWWPICWPLAPAVVAARSKTTAQLLRAL